MNYSINFPNIGIFLKHVPRFINIGSFEIAMYGICIAFGMLIAIFLAVHEAKITGQNPDDYYNVSIIGIILGVIGARIYYVIFAWDEYKNNPSEIFNIRGGGLAIYGGIITAVLVMIVYSRIKKIDTWQMFDTVSTSILLGQIIGRYGNFFNREVFGEYTDSLLAMEIPVNAVNDSGDITSQMLSNSVVRDGVTYISVHPTFLYESLWNLCLFIALMFYRKHKKFQGEIFLMYIAGYGIGRFWIEGIRTDQLLISGTNIPVSQLISGVAALVCIITIVYKRIKMVQNGPDPKRTT